MCGVLRLTRRGSVRALLLSQLPRGTLLPRGYVMDERQGLVAEAFEEDGADAPTGFVAPPPMA